MKQSYAYAGLFQVVSTGLNLFWTKFERTYDKTGKDT